MPAPCTLLVTQAPGSTRQIKSEEARYNTWTQHHSHYPKDAKLGFNGRIDLEAWQDGPSIVQRHSNHAHDQNRMHIQ